MRNRCNPRTGDCRRNEFPERADGVAVTFIPDNDREETGGSGERAREGEGRGGRRGLWRGT